VLKPHAQAHLLSPTDKCKVCNEPAAKHVHYGAMTCFSCRAFFRRSIQNKTASTYVCRRSKSCEINLKTRKNCQFCRYNQCLGVGMKPTWVLSEEERQRRFRKNREKQEQGEILQGKDGRSRANSLNDLGGDFDLMDGASLADPLPGLLLLEQAAEERSRDTGPIIMEKHLQQQQQSVNIVVKSEQGSHIHNGEIMDQKENKHFFDTLCEPSITTTSIFVKTEPKLNFSCAPQYLVKDQKPMVPLSSNTAVGQQQQQQASNSQSNNLLFVTSSSQFPQVQQQSPTQTTSSSYMPCLPPVPRQTTLSQSAIVQHTRTSPPSFNMSTTPSVIVQATPSLPRYHHHHHQQHQQQASNNVDYVQDDSFPMEVGSFATVEADLVNSSQTYIYHQPNICPPLVSGIESDVFHSQILEDVQTYVEKEGYVAEEEEYYTTSEDEDEVTLALAAAAAWKEKLKHEPEIEMTDIEKEQLDKLVKQHEERYRSVNFGEELIKEMIMCSMFGIPVSTSAAIAGYRLTVERITRIAHNLECFTDLSKIDQNALLKENADLLVSLLGAIFFDSRKKGVDQVLISMGVDDMETINSMFTPLLQENQMKHIDYATFNSIQVIANPVTEQRYNSLQAKVAELICDEICVILVYYIILFSSDFCVLADRRQVERNQGTFLNMLHRYLYSKTPRHKACQEMASVLSSLTCLREMADIKKSRAINPTVKIS